MDQQQPNQQNIPPTIQPLPTQPQPVKPRHSFWPIIVLIILIAGVSAFGGFFVSRRVLTTSIRPTPLITPSYSPSSIPDITANWKTYTNTKHNFLFKYPLGFSVETKGNIETTTADGIILTDGCNYNAGNRCLTGFIDGNKVIYSVNKKLSDYFEYAPEQSPQIISEQSLTIGGEPALAREIFDDNYYYSSSEHGVVRYIIVVIYNQTVFHFDFLERGKDQKSILSTKDWHQKNYVDQILSTFKFSDTSPTSQFPKKYFQSTDMFLDQYKYPSELINLADTELVGFICSKKFSRDVEGKYTAYIEGSQQKELLTDHDVLPLLSTLEQKAKQEMSRNSMEAATVCSLDTGKKLLSYEISPGGGGAGSNVYFGILSGSFLSTTSVIPMENGPYFTCSDVLAITKTGIMYVICGAGDGGFGSKSLYKLNLNAGGTATLLYKCTSLSANEGGKETITCGTTQ
jgi:hypothetical protein